MFNSSHNWSQSGARNCAEVRPVSNIEQAEEAYGYEGACRPGDNPPQHQDVSQIITHSERDLTNKDKQDKESKGKFKHFVKKVKNDKGFMHRGWQALKSMVPGGHKASKTEWESFVNDLTVTVKKSGLKIAQVPVTDVVLNQDAYLRCCTLGQPDPSKPKKTILLIGETGTGKSTMINAILNYLLNVDYGDEYRFRLVDPDKDRGAVEKDESDSQTEFITAYTIPCIEGISPCPFEVTLIDTPGFGDTRGIERDRLLVSHLEEFFTNTKTYGVDTLDAVCFLVKATQVRLTSVQKYIFSSLLRIFGKNIKENILILVTFADSSVGKPPVLNVLKEGGVDFKNYFMTNNGALYAAKATVTDVDADSSSDEESNIFASNFWELNKKSFARFFKYVQFDLKPRSLKMTAEVLRERRHLQLSCKHIHSKIKELCYQLSLRQVEMENLKYFRDQKDLLSKFEYFVDEISLRSFPTELDIFSVACSNCRRPCHDPCDCDVSADRRGCIAFDEHKRCTFCPSKCSSADHVRENMHYEVEVKQVQHTVPDLEQKFESADVQMRYCEGKILEATDAYNQAKTDIVGCIMEGVKALNRLGEIALKQNRLSEIQYIEHVINDEMRMQKRGYDTRVKILRTVMKQLTEARSDEAPKRNIDKELDNVAFSEMRKGKPS